MTSQPIATLFRDHATDGVPSSGNHKPRKPDIRDTFNAYFLYLTGANSGAIVKTAKSTLDADLAHDADVMAWVIGDATSSNDGVYQKSGASGAGSWAKRGPLPYPVIQLNNAGSGTADAIVVTTAVGIPSAAYNAIYVLNITATNTATSVTVAINGAPAKPIKTVTGNDPSIGALTASMSMLCVDDGTNLRLLTDLDSSAAQAAAEAARDAAIAAAAGASGAFPVVDRTALKALDTTSKKVAVIYGEGNRNGTFFWLTGDQSGHVTNDPTEGIYLKADAIATTSGAWKRLFVGPIMPQWFGATGDGVFFSDGAITAAGTTFTSASASFVSGDVGKLIKVGGAGASAATLITTIASINSGTSVELTAAAGSTVSGANYTYGSNDTAAIKAARDFCWAEAVSMRGAPTLAFSGGRYCFNETLEFARSAWTVASLDAGVWLDYFGASASYPVSLNGLSYDPTHGCFNFHFGGAYRINIRGNSFATAILYYNNVHFGSISANLRDGNIGLFGDNDNGMGGTQGSGAAVDTDIDIRLAHHDWDTFDTVPAVGWYMTKTYVCRIKMQVEVSGSAADNFGVYMVESNRNTFNGGTVESCFYGGIWITSTCYSNTFVGMHNESNGLGPDWKIDGHHTKLVNCSGVATYLTASGPANEINGDYTLIEGGEFNDFTTNPSADHTRAIGADLSTGTVADNSASTTFEDCKGVIDKAPPPAKSALTLGTNIADYALTDANYQTPVYFRTRSGLVGISGTVISTGAISAGATVAVLPAGYRPSKKIGTGVAHNLSTEGHNGLTIDSSGNVITRSAISSGHILALDGIQFLLPG